LEVDTKRKTFTSASSPLLKKDISYLASQFCVHHVAELQGPPI
jgi:hypothetical protein